MTLPARRKYNVDHSPEGRAKRTYKDVVYDSLAEARYAAELDLKVRAGVIRKWRRQVPFDLTVNGERVCRMRLDFEVEWPDGRLELVDVKGHATADWKLKAKLFWAVYGREIRVVSSRTVRT